MLFRGIIYGFIIFYGIASFIIVGGVSFRYVLNCFMTAEREKTLVKTAYKGNPETTQWIIDYYLNLKD